MYKTFHKNRRVILKEIEIKGGNILWRERESERERVFFGKVY